MRDLVMLMLLTIGRGVFDVRKKKKRIEFITESLLSTSGSMCAAPRILILIQIFLILPLRMTISHVHVLMLMISRTWEGMSVFLVKAWHNKMFSPVMSLFVVCHWQATSSQHKYMCRFDRKVYWLDLQQCMCIWHLCKKKERRIVRTHC